MPKIEIGDPKKTREILFSALCALIAKKDKKIGPEIVRIERMIDQIDILRPLGPDGEHGDRHTKDCGCEDVARYTDGRPRPKNSAYVSNK